MCQVLERPSTRLSTFPHKVYICVRKKLLCVILDYIDQTSEASKCPNCLNMFGSKCRIVQVFLQHVEDITILA